MGEIIRIYDWSKPTHCDGRPLEFLQGIIICFTCDTESEGVAPIGSFWLTCPDCNTNRAVFKNNLAVKDNTPIYQCTRCSEVQVFYIVYTGAMCLGCGFTHTWDQLVPSDEPPRLA